MTVEPFALVISPGRPFMFTGFSWLELKMVSLSNPSNSSKTVVSVQRKGQDYVLCTLVPERREQVQIDLHLSTDDIPLTRFAFSGENHVLLTGYTGIARTQREIKRKNTVQFTATLESYESDDTDDHEEEEEEEEEERQEGDGSPNDHVELDLEGDDNEKDADTDIDIDTDAGTNAETDIINDVIHQEVGEDDTDDDDKDDEDFVPDDDEDMMQSISNRFHFCDTSDRRFISGLELRHFGLQPTHGYEEDGINLREDEADMLEKETNDNIALALINGLANSGEMPHMTKAPKLLEKLKETAPEIDSRIVRFEDTDQNMFKKKRKLTDDDTASEPAKRQKKAGRKMLASRRRKFNNEWIVS